MPMILNHFNLRRCPCCSYVFNKFDEGMIFQIQSIDLDDDVKVDPHFVLKSFFSRAEEHFMNPVFVNGGKAFDFKNGDSTYRIRFIEGVYCCPRCDEVEKVDAFDNKSLKDFRDFVKELMNERKYK